VNGCVPQRQSFDMCETLLFSEIHLDQQRGTIRMGTSHSRTEKAKRVHLAGEVVKGVGKSFRLRGHATRSVVDVQPTVAEQGDESTRSTPGDCREADGGNGFGTANPGNAAPVVIPRSVKMVW
jgi:hypothetical protein